MTGIAANPKIPLEHKGKNVGRLLSVNVSRVEEVRFKDKAVPTGIFKKPVSGAVRIGFAGVENDEQADLRVHGGPHKAVYIFGEPGYDHWKRFLGRHLSPGTFGENLTIEALHEDEIRIGDLIVCGELVLQVSEPRISCFKLAMTLQEDPRFSKIFLEDGRVGFYARVLQEGTIVRGDQITHLPTTVESPTVREFVKAAYDPNASLATLRYARNSLGLSSNWRGVLAKRASALTLAKQGRPWPGFKPFTVVRRETECDGIASFYLRPKDTTDLPGFLPGQHIVIRTTIPPHGDVMRSYSLSSGSPIDGALRITIKRSTVGSDPTRVAQVSMSNHLHNEIFEGSTLGVKAPAGQFFIDQTDDTPLILLAGGVGITPLFAMFESAAKTGCSATLVFAARNEAERCFRGAIEALCATHSNLRAIFLNEEPIDPAMAHNTRLGRLGPEILNEIGLERVSVFVCGPPGFIDASQALLTECGVAADRVHIETFGARAIRSDRPRVASDANHKVTFKTSGFDVQWTGEHGTLLDLAEANGLRPPFACRAGTCQSCATRVVSGSFDYLALVDPPSADEAYICCTIPTSDVVLDL